MNKNKRTALILAALSFVAFYWGFMEIGEASPFVSLAGFVVLLATSIGAMAIGNAGDR